MCVCTCQKRYMYKKDWLEGRSEVNTGAGRKRTQKKKEKREAYNQLHVSTTYGHVRYPPANPDA